MLKVYTPFQKGELGYKAGCTIHDAPEDLTATEKKEWQEGWRKADAVCKLHINDNDKFCVDPTGGM